MKRTLGVGLTLFLALPVGAADLGFAKKLAQEGDCYRAVSELLWIEYQEGPSPEIWAVKLPCLAQQRLWEEYDPTLELALRDPRTSAAQAKAWRLEGLEQAIQRQEGTKALALATALDPAQAQSFPLEPQDRLDPKPATLASAILPGSGLAYAGKWGPAGVSLALNALFLVGAKTAWDRGAPALTGLLLFFEWGWYQGGQNAAFEAATQHNRQALQQEQQTWLFEFNSRF